MRTETVSLPIALSVTLVACFAVGCSKEETPPKTTASASATAAPSAPSAAGPASAPSASAPPASASASSAVPARVVECPKGAAGEGSFSKPCEAKGTARMMDVAWTGKTDDKGPHFRVTNKSPQVILYGKIAVYFYDKAGKQLEAKDASGKAAPFHTCSGNMFGGVMKAAEKAVLTFSCVGPKVVPEGTAAVEAEMVTVGFSDASEKKVDFYWSNPELAKDARPKGGAKK